MNKVLRKMDYKGTAALTFVLVGMIFLVSSGTEKALAAPPASPPKAQQITAEATGLCGPATNINSCLFTLKDKGLSKGSWVTQPSQSGTRVLWSTTGGGVGAETGWVKYDVKSQSSGTSKEVQMNFDNPVWPKKNSCSVSPSNAGSCNAGSGTSASFTYNIKGPE